LRLILRTGLRLERSDFLIDIFFRGAAGQQYGATEYRAQDSDFPHVTLSACSTSRRSPAYSG
jgi:hypothetical protein